MSSTRSAPLTVAWFTYFPVEWLEEAPDEVAQLPRMHPATWQRVLLRELQKDDSLRIHVIALRRHFPRSMSFQSGNVTFHCQKSPGGLRAPSLFWTDTLQVSRLLKAIRPDLVHAWGTENGAAAIATRLRYPSLLTMQGILGWIVDLGMANSYTRLGAWLEGRSLRRSRFVTAESSFAVSYLGRRYPNLEIHQIEHAPNWLFHQTPRHPRTHPPRFINVGTQGHAKGTDVMLEALAPLCSEMDFELLMVGGAAPATLEAYRARFPTELWSRMRFKNHLTPDQLAAELSEAALMIYPTRADNSPNAVKEAVAAGLPVVASAVGGIVDYVHEGRNGFLFEAGNVEACRRAIRTARSHASLREGIVDPETLRQSRSYLSPSTMAAKFTALYRHIPAAFG